MGVRWVEDGGGVGRGWGERKRRRKGRWVRVEEEDGMGGGRGCTPHPSVYPTHHLTFPLYPYPTTHPSPLSPPSLHPISPPPPPPLLHPYLPPSLHPYLPSPLPYLPLPFTLSPTPLHKGWPNSTTPGNQHVSSLVEWSKMQCTVKPDQNLTTTQTGCIREVTSSFGTPKLAVSRPIIQVNEH
jgi:hypothetical protein